MTLSLIEQGGTEKSEKSCEMLASDGIEDEMEEPSCTLKPGRAETHIDQQVTRQILSKLGFS